MSETITAKNEPKKAKIIEYLRKAPIIQLACEQADVGRASFYRWKKEDQAFAEAVDEALTTGNSLINDLAESKLIASIKEMNFPAIAFWLKHHHPAYTTRVELSLNKTPLTDELSPEEQNMVERALKVVTQPEIESLNEEAHDATPIQ